MNGTTGPVSYFASGPSKLPEEVISQIQRDVRLYKDTKISVLEVSHRSADFARILDSTEQLVRDLLDVPDNYRVLFLQGGGTGLFAAIPLNLLGDPHKKAAYFVTGGWSAKAMKEAARFGEIVPVLPSVSKYRDIPDRSHWNIPPDVSYVYYCDNETVDGVEFDSIPEVADSIPLICDMSSNCFSRQVDVSKFGLIFAGSPKNLGCPGVTLVVVRDDLLGRASPFCPSVLNFEVMAQSKSNLNTPPTFAIYVFGQVLSWIRKRGGVEEMRKLAEVKSKVIYSAIDESNGFYSNLVSTRARSRLNAVFRIGSPEGNKELEEEFLSRATESDLLSLKGHRTVGGVRVALYSAISIDAIMKLKEFMIEFMNEKKGKVMNGN